MKRDKPIPYETPLWGIWWPAGACHTKGSWLVHLEPRRVRLDLDGPEAYVNRATAERVAKAYQDDYPGCYAAPLTARPKRKRARPKT